MFNMYPTLEKYPNSDFFCLKNEKGIITDDKGKCSFEDTFEGTIWIFVFLILLG